MVPSLKTNTACKSKFPSFNFAENKTRELVDFYVNKKDVYRAPYVSGGELEKEFLGAFEYEDTLPHGHGIFTFSNGSVYNGEWKDGKSDGQGTFTFPDGAVYDGEWKDGKSDGQGKMTYEDGSVYNGEWKEDKFNGRGKITWSSVSD